MFGNVNLFLSIFQLFSVVFSLKCKSSSSNEPNSLNAVLDPDVVAIGMPSASAGEP